MTAVVDARDVDHAADVYARTTWCDHATNDLCPRCTLLGQLQQARRFEAWEAPI